MKWGLPALAALLLFYPFILTGPFYWDIGVAFLLAAISASAWNIVGGYAGQVSVGHSMFFGVGAYTPLLFYHLWGLPPVAGVPAGILVSLGLALVVGMPTFRLQGHYFSMATIAVAELIRIFVGTWDLVGAAIGLQGPAVGRGWWDLTFRSELPYYYIFLAVLAVVLYTTFEVERSRFGYYLRAIKAGERAARSLGVPVRETKLKALMLSALFTSLAGSLYSIKTGFIDPESGRRGGAVRPARRCADPGAAANRDQYLVRRRRLGPHLHPLWRHHRVARAVRAGRHARMVASRGALAGEA
ncbi:MAG: branched-chain amino acid ABC transporter permease [Alphaproteobacteria bacterium]|nr:MAG: branched-chain amino acid ABC transporter permease [Alphaproteobacteria bacterium]